MYRSQCILFGLLFHFVSLSQIDYPAIYTDHNLPQFSGASLVELSRNTENLYDGVKLFLESSEDYATLRSFYESEMESNGWTLNESIAVKKMREMGRLDILPFSGEWEKGDLKFQVFTSRSKDKTKITLTFLKM